MAAAEDEDAVETVGAERSYPAFGVGIRVRRLDRCPDHFDGLGAEDLVEGVRELRVAIVYEEPEGVLIAELHDEVARLLGHPTPVGIRGGGDVLDPSRRERDEEQHVDPLEKRGLDGEEVAGKHARRLRAQEHAPRRMAPLRCRLKTFFKQHLPHRGRRHSHAQTLEFADDASVSPVWILACEAHDQRAQRRLERRPTGSPVRIRPAARDQLTVPAQQRLRLDREARPSDPRQRATQRCQQRSISPRQLRLQSLPTEHREFMAQHQDLELLRATRPRQ